MACFLFGRGTLFLMGLALFLGWAYWRTYRMDEPKKKRGFAAMDPEKRRALARLGGVRASEGGKAHRWTAAEAREAGKKGGASVREQRTTEV